MSFLSHDFFWHKFTCDCWVLKYVSLLQGKVAIGNTKEVNEEDHILCSDILQTLEASYAEILKESFILAHGVVGNLTDSESSNTGDEILSVGTITSWKDILQSYAVNLKLDHICDANEKLCSIVVCSFTFYTLLCFPNCIIVFIPSDFNCLLTEETG